MFADADDYFYENAFKELDKFADTDNDIIFFYCDSRDGATGEKVPDRLPDLKKNITERNTTALRYNCGTPCGKLIRQSLIDKHHIRFEETVVANDMMFAVMVGHVSKKIGIISPPLYCATKTANSLFHHHTQERILTRMKVQQRTNEFLRSCGQEQYEGSPLGIAAWLWPRHPIQFIRCVVACREKPTRQYLHSVVIHVFKKSQYEAKIVIYNLLKRLIGSRIGTLIRKKP